MTSNLQTFDSTVRLEDAVVALKRDGAIIVRDMISEDLVDQVVSDLRPFIDSSPVGTADFTGARTRRCGGLLAKSMHVADLLTHPLFIGIGERILVKEQPYIFWNNQEKQELFPKLQLSVTQAIEILPGERAQPLHRDDCVHHRPHPGPETQVQIIYAMTDFTAANGGTRAVPGSHHWPPMKGPSASEAVPVEMPKGSGLIFFGSTFHGGGENSSSDQTRLAITLSLIPGHLRQEENQYLAVPLEVAKKHSEQVQELMGYVVSPPACGFVDLKDPKFLFETVE